MQIGVAIELFWCGWNGPWRVVLLAEFAHFLRLLVVYIVHVVHNGRDALEVRDELRLRYLLLLLTALLASMLFGFLNIHGEFHSLNGFTRTASASLHLLVIGLSGDVSEHKALLR